MSAISTLACSIREFLHVPFVIKWPQQASGFQAGWQSQSAWSTRPTLVDGLSLPDPARRDTRAAA